MNKKLNTFLLIASLMFAFYGCSSIHSRHKADIMSHGQVMELLNETFDDNFPLPVVNPFEISDEMKDFVEKNTRAYQTPEAVFNSIVDSIFSSTEPVIYDERKTHTAIETFETRTGNCLSLTNMFIAMSRYARLDTFFIEVLDHMAWTSDGDIIMNNGHIIAGMNFYKLKMRGGVPSGYITVDFYPSRPKTYRHLEAIDDLLAIVYFYNNLGVELLRNNETDRAIILFENILRLNKASDKVYNNLGVSYSKKRDFQKAYECYENGFKHNDKNISILTNLVFLSEFLQKDESFAFYSIKLEEIKNTNPYYFLQKAGQNLLNEDREGFFKNIRTAERLDPDIPDIYLLYVKYYIREKDYVLAKKNLEKAEKLKIDTETSRLFEKKLDYFMKK